MESKAEAVHSIRRLNPAVAPEFLAKFSDAQLRAYLDRLEASVGTRREIDWEPAGAGPSVRACPRAHALA